MLTSLLDMVRQKRPSGPLWTVDDAWKTDVLARMKELGISRADLARRLVVSQAAITVLFRPTTAQSRLVPRIHKILGMADGTHTVVAVSKDDAFRRLTKIWRDLTEEQRAHMLATGELLRATRPGH